MFPTQGRWSSTWQRKPAPSGPWLRALPNSQYALQQKQCLSGKATAPCFTHSIFKVLCGEGWRIIINSLFFQKRNQKTSAEWKQRAFNFKYKAIKLTSLCCFSRGIAQGSTSASRLNAHYVPVPWIPNMISNHHSEQLEFNVLVKYITLKPNAFQNVCVEVLF